MLNAYPIQTVMANGAMVIGFTGRDVATSCQWLDPQLQQPTHFVLKRKHERVDARLDGLKRRETPMRLPTPSRRPSPVCRPAFSRGG